MNRKEFLIKGSAAGVGAWASLSCMSPFIASKNDVVNVGIIGTGRRGTGLISLINSIPNLNVAGCCDVLPFRLEEGLKRAKSKPKAFSDYRRLLDDSDIDAVIIATPFSTHSDIAIDAIDAGKHVFAEKTLAKGYDGIKQLIKANRSNSNTFQTGHQYHSSRLYTHVVDLIKNGKVGNITAFDCQWNRNGNWRREVPKPELERLINWRMYREYSGGLVAELCSHQIDFVNWVLEATPQQVMGVGGVDYWKDGRETYDNIHLIYTYPDGIKAKFTCLTSNANEGYQIKVKGDKGTIIIGYRKAWFYPEQTEQEKEKGIVDGVSGATVQWEKGKGIPIHVEHPNPSEQALMDFASSITNQKPPISNIITGSHTAIAVQMGLDAMYNNKIVSWDKDFDNYLFN
jgi:predicted dehydrogenase